MEPEGTEILIQIYDLIHLPGHATGIECCHDNYMTSGSGRPEYNVCAHFRAQTYVTTSSKAAGNTVPGSHRDSSRGTPRSRSAHDHAGAGASGKARGG